MQEIKKIYAYDAIREMRRLSSEGKPFSFAHFTYDDHRRQSHGLRVVNRAKLRPSTSDDKISNSSFKLFYTDLIDKKPYVCWQPLLAYFNGMRITFKR